jgi:MFS family permease
MTPTGEARPRIGWARRTFHSLRVRNFRLYIAGQAVSTTGTWMQLVAVPWLVLELSGSGVALGVDTALLFLPILLFGAWGGVVADRFDNRRVQIATQIAYAILAVVLWALVVSGVVALWMVFALSFLTGVVTAIDMPTRQSFYLEMVGPADLTNAMSLNTATFTGMRIVGPAIAGVLIAWKGTAPVFLINAISYLAAIAALMAMRTGELHLRPRAARSKRMIRAGIRYVLDTPALRLPLTLMLVVFLFGFNFAVLVPLLATRTFGGTSTTFGAMLALFGVGSLAGALAMASRATRPSPRRLAVLGIGLGALSIGLAAAPTLAVAYLLLPAVGAAAIAFAITGNSTLQLTSSPDMRGRVMALYSVVFLGSNPISGPIAGWVGETLGPRVAIAAGGLVAVAAGLLGLAAVTRSLSSAEPVTP